MTNTKNTVSEMMDFFAAADRAAAVPLTAPETTRLAALDAQARTTGIGGADRLVWIRLQARRNAR